MKKIFASILLSLSFLLSSVSPSFAAENIHIDSAEWLNSHTIRFHYSDNDYAPGGVALIFTASDGSRTLHAGAQNYPDTDVSGYFDFDAGSDTDSLYWGADSGYTRYYALTGYSDEENMSNTFRLAAYVPPNIVIIASPSAGVRTVGSPFSVNITVNSEGEAFNAARASVSASSNLTINSISAPTSNSCNMQYTQTPTTSNPSFAGAIYGSSSESCNVYTMVVTPNDTGTGTITFTNGSVKAYSDNSEIMTGVTNASFTLSDGPTPTPTPLLEFAVTSPYETYKENFTITGTKLDTITAMFLNGDDTDSVYPTSTTWEIPVTLALGDNNYTLYGSDGTNQTATQNVIIDRHTLGDINGDGEIDLIDASLFAVDWDKTEGLTYILSDMNDDGVVDLTDLSILAKLQE